MRVAIETERFPNPRSVAYLRQHLARHPNACEVKNGESKVDLVITSGHPDLLGNQGPAMSVQFGVGDHATASYPGFWESWFGDAGTGFGIWGKENATARWEPLLTGRFRTQGSPSENFHRITTEPLPHLCAALDSFIATQTFPRSAQAKRVAPPSLGQPSPFNQFAINVRLTTRQAIRAMRRLLRGRPRSWAVSYLLNPGVKPEWAESTFIQAPDGHFYADPFLVNFGGQKLCFVEDFDANLGRACISAIRIHDATNYEILGPIISEPFHLSFPFPIQFQNQLFVVPESADVKSIRMYRCVGFPKAWELSSILMKDVQAYDTQIFPVSDTWHLFTTMTPSGMRDIDSRLNVFEASEPNSTDWTPRSPLPLMVDPVGSRNAGFLDSPEGPIRAAQVNSVGTYGAGLRIPDAPEYVDWEFAGGHHLHVTSWGAVRDWLEPSFS